MPGRSTRKKPRSPITFLLPLVLAASLGGVLYLVISSLPYLAGTGTADLSFGSLNECAQRGLTGSRSGLAVAADGKSLAMYSGQSLIWCGAQADGGSTARPFALDGITAAAFDFDGGLWVARGEHLFLIGAGDEPTSMGDVAPLALTGTRHGVVALEGSGRLLAVKRDGSVAALAQLPREVGSDASLTTSADGTRVALIAGGGVFVWNAEDLKALRAEAPCPVEFLWWRPEGHRALISCGPKSSWALDYDVESGATNPAKVPASRSTLLPARGLYFQPCEGLACTAPSP